MHLVANAPALTFTNALSITYYAGIGMATASNNFVAGAVQGDLVLGAFNTSSILFCNNNTNTLRMSLNGSGAAIFSGSVTGRGPKSQIIADGNSVGAGILLSNSIVGVNRRNWGIFTEQNVEGDFAIKCSTASGGDAQNGNTRLAILNDGNVGISTSSPQGKLDISSGLRNGTTSTLFMGADADSSSGTRTNNTRKLASIATPSYTNANRPVFGIAMDNQVSDNFIYIGGAYSGYNAATTIAFSTGATNNTETGSERMRITSGGNVGIGTSSPTYLLQVNSSTTAAHIHLTNSTTGNTSNDGTRLFAAGLDAYLANREAGAIIFETSDTERMRITSGGYVGINTQSPRGYFNVKNGSGELVLSQGNGRDIQAIFNGSQGNMDLSCNNLYISYLGTGTVYSNGGVLTNTNPSDANLKENITDLTFGLNEILQLRPVSYDWKNNVANQSTQYGFIAQEVQKVLPQLVTEFDSYEDEKREVSIKRLGLDKDAIFVSLVKAIQELEARIKQLENK